MAELSINQCLEYIQQQGLWMGITINHEGLITARPVTQPRESDALQVSVLDEAEQGTDLQVVLNEIVAKLK